MFTTVPISGGAVHSSVRLWLRLEGLMALLLATYLYAHQGGSWLVFAILFFTPDVSFAGYIAGPRIGAALYNVAHSYVGPLLLATLLSAGTGLTLALVWGSAQWIRPRIGLRAEVPQWFWRYAPRTDRTAGFHSTGLVLRLPGSRGLVASNSGGPGAVATRMTASEIAAWIARSREPSRSDRKP